MKCNNLFSFAITSILILALHSAAPAHADGGPSEEIVKQAIDEKLQILKPDPKGERNVLFQNVQAASSGDAGYTYKVSFLIRDYDSGFPPNHYYGQTCVGQIKDSLYTLTVDQSGKWKIEGRMTPDLADKQCKPNPAAGVSSISLATLNGTTASATPANNHPAQPTPAPQAVDGKTVATGAYECWSNGEARMLLNFKITSNSSYIGSDGQTGSFIFDSSSGQMHFKGGALDGVMPDGFISIYHVVQGRPTLSFMGPSGGEAAFCQK